MLHAKLVVALATLLSLVCAVYSARNLPINADTSEIISNESPVRRLTAEFDRIFPHGSDLLVAVIDAPTADEATDAAAAPRGGSQRNHPSSVRSSARTLRRSSGATGFSSFPCRR